MDISYILEHYNVKDIYNTYFKRENQNISVIFTKYKELIDNFKDYKPKEILKNVAYKIIQSCQGINEYYIAFLLDDISRKENTIILLPCKTPCNIFKDLYGILIAEYQNKEKFIFIHILCENGSFLITLIIFIGKYLGMKKIILDSVKSAYKFYKKYGFIEDNYRIINDKTLTPLVLDLSIYNNENLERIKKREYPYILNNDNNYSYTEI